MKDKIEFRPIPDNQVGVAFEAWRQSEEGQALSADLERQKKRQFHCDGIRQEASGFEHSPDRTVFYQSSFDQPLIGERLDLVRFLFKGRIEFMPVNEFLERMAATRTVEKQVRQGSYDDNWGSQSHSANVKLTVYSEGARAVAMVKQETSWGHRADFTEAYQGNSELTVHKVVVHQQKTVIDDEFLAKYGIEPGTQRVIAGRIRLPFKPLSKSR